MFYRNVFAGGTEETNWGSRETSLKVRTWDVRGVSRLLGPMMERYSVDEVIDVMTSQEHTYLQIERFLLKFPLAESRNHQHLIVFLLEWEASRSSHEMGEIYLKRVVFLARQHINHLVNPSSFHPRSQQSSTLLSRSKSGPLMKSRDYLSWSLLFPPANFF